MPINKNWVLFTILFSIPIGGIAIDLYTPSLPSMVQAFQTTPALVKLTIGAFLLGGALGQLILAPLSDIWGRRPIKTFGALLFALSSLAVVFVPNIEWVIFLRFLQGISTGAVTSTSRAKISDIFEKHEIRIISTYISISWSLGPIIAPWIGGYIEHYLGWRYNFYLFALYAFLIFVLNQFFVPETHQQKTAFRFKQMLTNYKTLLIDQHFIGSLGLMGLCYSILIVFGVIGPFLLQVEMGYSPIDYGYIALMMGIGYFLGTFLGRALHKVLERTLLFRGLGFISILIFSGLILTELMPTSLFAFCIPIILVCAGVGVIFPIFLGKTISLFPTIAGAASALTGFGNAVIGALAAFVISFIRVSTSLEAVLLYAGLVALLWLVVFGLLRKHL